MDGEKRECDEMMNFLAVAMHVLVASSSESTPPPHGEKEHYKHMYLITINESTEITFSLSQHYR